jgi:hypothetical protein
MLRPQGLGVPCLGLRRSSLRPAAGCIPFGVSVLSGQIYDAATFCQQSCAQYLNWKPTITNVRVTFHFRVDAIESHRQIGEIET